MATGTLVVQIEGISPLLLHNAAAMLGQPDATRGKSNIPDPATEAERGVYRDADGQLCLQGVAVRGALVKAGSTWKIDRKFAKSLLAPCFVDPDLVLLRDPDTGHVLSEYVVDVRRAVVQKQGIARARPRFDRWAASFELYYDDELVRKPEILLDILADAGARVGLGDFRPEKGGPYGRFRVRRD